MPLEFSQPDITMFTINEPEFNICLHVNVQHIHLTFMGNHQHNSSKLNDGSWVKTELKATLNVGVHHCNRQS
jgi:hypothetical protein